MFASMNPFPLFLLFLATCASVLVAQDTKPTSRITVVGSVYCDTCHGNTFSRHSYFLPGVDVHVQCKFKADSAENTEQISFSVNRTTNRYGVYKLEMPSLEGVDCVEGTEAIQSFCEASLIRQRSSSACNVPGMKATANEIAVKSKQANLCVYSLSALSYAPPEKNITLCGKKDKESKFSSSFNSSKFFLPYFPPYSFPWPPLPQLPPLPALPPLPQLPPFPSFPFPPLPPLPSFPFPPLPFTNPPTISSSPPPPPPPPAYFDFRDPRTWIPNIPENSPPSPPQLPPPPPSFNLRDPRTWLPAIPPAPSTSP